MSSPRRYNDDSLGDGNGDRDRSQSAIEVYRKWLNESSSSSDGDGNDDKTMDVDVKDDSIGKANRPSSISTSTSRDASRANAELAPPLPKRTPTMPAQNRHLHANKAAPKTRSPLSHSNSPSAPSNKSPRLLSRPRRLMQQMSFRSMLPSTTSPSPSAERLHPRVPKQPTRSRRKSSDHGMATLYGSAGIAQPTMVKMSGSTETPTQRFYNVPLDGAADRKASIYSASSGFSANSTEKRNRRSHSWEYHTRDSKTGWAIVFWAFLACFISLSTLFSYPVYESYYQTTTRDSLFPNGDPLILTDPDRPQEDFVTWRFSSLATTYSVLIGTLLLGFSFLATLPAGIITDMWGARTSCLTGTLVLFVSLLSASFTDRLWALCILQGFLAGVGVGLLFAPAYTIPMQWFDRYQALSTCAVISGSALGTLALAAVYNALIQSHGLSASLRVQAVVSLGLGVLASWGLRPRVRVPLAPKLPLTKHDLRLPCLMLLSLFASASRCIQLLCLPAFARSAGETSDGAHVIYALAASAVVGAPLGALLCDKFRDWPTIAICELVAAILTLAIWVPSASLAPMYVYAVLAGISTGSLASALPLVVCQMFGQARLPTIVGCILAAGCPAILAVTPAAIKFSDLLNDNRSTAWLTAIAGILSLAASALAFLVYFAQCQRQKTTQERGPEAASY